MNGCETFNNQDRKTQIKDDPYEEFKAELQANIRQTITWQRANGVLAMSKENLMQVTPTPKESVGPVEQMRDGYIGKCSTMRLLRYRAPIAHSWSVSGAR